MVIFSLKAGLCFIDDMACFLLLEYQIPFIELALTSVKIVLFSFESWKAETSVAAFNDFLSFFIIVDRIF